MTSASTNKGSVPTQNLDQRRSRTDIGLDRNNQRVRPSRLTPGKMNRAAIEASTKPASTRFRNGTTLRRKNVIPSPLRGRNLMLKMYTTTRTARRSSCDHCVVSRKKTRSSFSTSSRRSTPNGASTRSAMCRRRLPRAHRSALSCALLKPCGYSRQCKSAPRTTAAAAVDQSRYHGKRSVL